MTDELTPTTSTSAGSATLATASPISRLFVGAAVLIGIGLLIDLITWNGWDRGGWIDSDGEVVDAGPFPWTGIVIAAFPTFVGLVLLTIAIIAKGVELGRRASSVEQDG